MFSFQFNLRSWDKEMNLLGAGVVVSTKNVRLVPCPTFTALVPSFL